MFNMIKSKVFFDRESSHERGVNFTFFSFSQRYNYWRNFNSSRFAVNVLCALIPGTCITNTEWAGIIKQWYYWSAFHMDSNLRLNRKIKLCVIYVYKQNIEIVLRVISCFIQTPQKLTVYWYKTEKEKKMTKK